MQPMISGMSHAQRPPRQRLSPNAAVGSCGGYATSTFIALRVKMSYTESDELQAKLYILCGRAAFRLRYDAWLAKRDGTAAGQVAPLAMEQLQNHCDANEQYPGDEEHAT